MAFHAVVFLDEADEIDCGCPLGAMFYSSHGFVCLQKTKRESRCDNWILTSCAPVHAFCTYTPAHVSSVAMTTQPESRFRFN